MSTEVLERTYGHHHPDCMRAAAQAITRNNRRTFHWSFRWSSRNRARPKDKKANSCMVEDSVLREPVSTKNSPLTGKNTGKLRETSEFGHYSRPELIVKSVLSAKFLTPKNRECLAA